MTRRCAGRRHCGSQRGAIAGGEGVLFGMLVLVAGALVVINLWAVIDTRAALDAAAREYLRSYTEQRDGSAARTRGRAALDDVLRSRGTDPGDVRVAFVEPNGFGPCALAQVELAATIPGARVPFLDTIGSTEVHVVHRELVDAHREVTPDASYDPTATDCAGE